MKDIKTGRVLRRAIASALATWCATASAGTVAWYHFEDAANGTVASYSDTLVNSVDPSVLPMRMRWMKSNTAEFSDDEVAVAGSACRPTFEDVLPPGLSWSNGSSVGLRRTGLHLNMYGNSVSSAAGFVQIVDDAAASRLQLQTFTIEFFVRLDMAKETALGTQLSLLSMRAGSTDAFRFKINNDSNAKINYQFKTPAGNTSEAVSDVTPLRDGNLHHVAFVKTPTSFRIFVDYSRKLNKTYESGSCDIDYGSDGNILEIGANSRLNYGRTPCWIDEVRISDTALGTSSFLGFGERRENDSMLSPDTLVYHDFDTNRVNFAGTRIFNNLATAVNAPTLSIVTPTGGRVPALVTDDYYASNMWFTADADCVPNAGCWDFSYGDTNGLSSMMLIDDMKPSGGASHQIYDSDSTIEMMVKFLEDPTITEMLWHTQIGTAEHHTYSTRIYAASSGDIVFSLVSQAQADAHLVSGNPTRAERTKTGGALDRKWHHLALVNDRSHGKVRCYWDYKLVGDEWSGYLATNAYPAILSRTAIRVSGQGLEKPQSDDRVQFKGRLDMLRVTARALAPEEFVRAFKEKRGTLIIFH